MKILIRNSDNVVIYARDDLVLTETRCEGDGWADNNFNSGNATVADATPPPLWSGAIWSCVAGTWAISDTVGHQRLLDADAAKVARNQADAESQRISRLWQAAHDYEFAQVSGSAIGLLAVGVMRDKPKCVAVQGWIKQIWAEYYTRKANGSSDCCYRVSGACPHSVPELMAELGL